MKLARAFLALTVVCLVYSTPQAFSTPAGQAEVDWEGLPEFLTFPGEDCLELGESGKLGIDVCCDGNHLTTPNSNFTCGAARAVQHNDRSLNSLLFTYLDPNCESSPSAKSSTNLCVAISFTSPELLSAERIRLYRFFDRSWAFAGETYVKVGSNLSVTVFDTLHNSHPKHAGKLTTLDALYTYDHLYLIEALDREGKVVVSTPNPISIFPSMFLSFSATETDVNDKPRPPVPICDECTNPEDEKANFSKVTWKFPDGTTCATYSDFCPADIDPELDGKRKQVKDQVCADLSEESKQLTFNCDASACCYGGKCVPSAGKVSIRDTTPSLEPGDEKTLGSGQADFSDERRPLPYDCELNFEHDELPWRTLNAEPCFPARQSCAYSLSGNFLFAEELGELATLGGKHKVKVSASNCCIADSSFEIVHKVPFSCVETDEGRDLKTKGEAELKLSEYRLDSGIDQCASHNEVKEFYCKEASSTEASLLKEVVDPCSADSCCDLGACIPKSGGIELRLNSLSEGGTPGELKISGLAKLVGNKRPLYRQPVSACETRIEIPSLGYRKFCLESSNRQFKSTETCSFEKQVTLEQLMKAANERGEILVRVETEKCCLEDGKLSDEAWLKIPQVVVSPSHFVEPIRNAGYKLVARDLHGGKVSSIVIDQISTSKTPIVNNDKGPVLELVPSGGSEVSVVDGYWFGWDKGVVEEKCSGDSFEYLVKMTVTVDGVAVPVEHTVTIELGDVGETHSRVITRTDQDGLDNSLVRTINNETECCYQVQATPEFIKPRCEESIEVKNHFLPRAIAEEERHSEQVCGDLPWSEGGVSSLYSKAKFDSILGQVYEKDTFCKSHADYELSLLTCQAAADEATRAALEVRKALHDIVKYYRAGRTDIYCWIEYTAKRHVGLTPGRGAYHYECAYQRKCSDFDFRNGTEPPSLEPTV